MNTLKMQRVPIISMYEIRNFQIYVIKDKKHKIHCIPSSGIYLLREKNAAFNLKNLPIKEI